MASGNGFQVCRALRSNDDLRHTKIVVVSGRHFEKDRQAAFKAGADEYVTKPIDADRLVLLLSRIAARAGGVRSNLTAPVVSLSRGPTRLKFWGVRGSIPTPGPDAPSSTAATPPASKSAPMARSSFSTPARACACWGSSWSPNSTTQPLDLTLLLTHTHWDHIQGLPFFLPVYKPQNHLRILGYEGARHGLEVVLAGQMESPFFPIGLREVPANVRIEELKEMSFNVGPVRVRGRLRQSSRDMRRLPPVHLRRLDRLLPRQRTVPRERPSAANRGWPQDEPAQSFARSENRKMIDFLRGTDVLIMDTQYDAEEYKHHTGWGHGCLDDVVALALEAEVKTLFLFHHDPNHDDAKVSQMLAHARKLVAARKGKLQVEAAREGVTVELPAAVRA